MVRILWRKFDKGPQTKIENNVPDREPAKNQRTLTAIRVPKMKKITNLSFAAVLCRERLSVYLLHLISIEYSKLIKLLSNVKNNIERT